MDRELEDGSPAGYGPGDRELGASLANAASEAEADGIARAAGFEDAQDARDWLRGRS